MLTAISGCYPKGPEYTTDFDLVYTNHTSDFPFSQRKTFALPDSVVKLTGEAPPSAGAPPPMLASTFSTVIIKQLKQDMQNYGWTLVDKNSQPDVILLALSTTTTNLYYYYDWGYWGWWYPYWGYGWGWYYPGYYPPYVSYYKTGSVLIQMVDQHSVTPQTVDMPVVWVSVLNGLVEGTNADVAHRIQVNIDQAFAQSPYLNIKP
jgi:hypothetical protein